MVLKQPLALAVYLLSGVFLVLGGLFVAAPGVAAAVYGLPTQDRSALFYVRAIRFRDVALAAHLIGLMLSRRWRALTIVIACTLVIPIGDLLLLASAGTGELVHYLLHGASLLCFAGLALWSLRAARAP